MYVSRAKADFKGVFRPDTHEEIETNVNVFTLLRLVNYKMIHSLPGTRWMVKDNQHKTFMLGAIAHRGIDISIMVKGQRFTYQTHRGFAAKIDRLERQLEIYKDIYFGKAPEDELPRRSRKWREAGPNRMPKSLCT